MTQLIQYEHICIRMQDAGQIARQGNDLLSSSLSNTNSVFEE